MVLGNFPVILPTNSETKKISLCTIAFLSLGLLSCENDENFVDVNPKPIATQSAESTQEGYYVQAMAELLNKAVQNPIIFTRWITGLK